MKEICGIDISTCWKNTNQKKTSIFSDNFSSNGNVILQISDIVSICDWIIELNINSLDKIPWSENPLELNETLFKRDVLNCFKLYSSSMNFIEVRS